MGRAPCCTKVGLHRGPWTAREDALLIQYIEANGEGQWRSLPKKAGLLRCGKSCRLRWMNYLRPDIKRGNITPEEDDLIIRLHTLLGNRWSLIAGRLPDRTDNEIKNYWNTHLSKKLHPTHGSDPNIHKKRSEPGYGKGINSSTNNKNNKRRQKSLKLNQQKPIGEETKIHLPKPARVTSMVSLVTSMVSLTSISNNTTTTTTATTATASSSQCQAESLNHGSIFDTKIIDSEDVIMDIPWFSNYPYMVEENGFDTMMKTGLSGSYVNNDSIDPIDYNRDNLGAQNGNQQFEKLYEEYLELIKVDDDHIGYIGDDEVQLDSFTESFLI